MARSIASLVQVERYHRFWIDNEGSLRVIIVSPQQTSVHPEWRDLLMIQGKEQLDNFRALGRRLGYTISPLNPDPPLIFKKKGSTPNEPQPEISGHPSVGIASRYCGFHLYRCFMCRRVLLKPLLCSRCQTVVYW
jgi:hypothetical protein